MQQNQEKRDFNSLAQAWDENPARVKMAGAVAEAIAREVPLSADMDAMDYGAGTGLVSMALLPRLGKLVAADNSQGMLDVLAAKVANAGITNVRTMLLDLEKDPPPEERFHIIISSMAVHHIARPDQLINTLHTLLRPSGWLCIADLDAENGSFHRDNTGVHHHGFDRADMTRYFAAAGFEEVRVTTALTFNREVEDAGEREFSIFLAVGRKSA
jgi:ubiquinone/menaquinone biosynthesis C-methylase UbiE